MRDTDHPFPQRAREAWVDLRGRWDFAFDPDDVGVGAGWHRQPSFDRTIEVPYPPESAASGIGNPGPHRVVWYARRVTLPAAADRSVLHIGACDYRASVWCNGQLVAMHEGGGTPFTADLTDALVAGGPQLIVVRAEDDPADPFQPRGKQDWQDRPHEVWYQRTTGLWQAVWVEQVPAVHVTDLAWTFDLAAGTVTASIELSRAAVPGTRVGIRLVLEGEELADASATVSGDWARVTLSVPRLANAQAAHALMWSSEHPVLLDAEVRVGADRVTSYLGLREVAAQDGLLTLNGSPLPLRMVLSQGYWPDSHLAADDAALRREVELVRELGFNGMRLHQKLEDPRLLYWCDRLGVLAWVEMPSAYGFSARSVQRLSAEWTAAVRRDRSHPSVVAWVPVNESWGVQFIARDAAQRALVEALVHLTRALDPSRPVVGNDGWESPAGDLLTVHDYSGSAEVLAARYGNRDAVSATLAAGWPSARRLVVGEHPPVDRPVVLSEFGGLSLGTVGTGEYSYTALPDADELADRLAAMVGTVRDSDGLAGFCWTQLTDTRQERNGLVDEHRVPKLDPAVIRAIFTGRPS